MTNDTPIPDDILAASFDLVESLESNKADAAATSDERYARLLTNDANLIARASMAERAKWEAELATLRAENERLRDAVIGIEEYWNGGSESAVDAAEEMRDRARSALKGGA